LRSSGICARVSSKAERACSTSSEVVSPRVGAPAGNVVRVAQRSEVRFRDLDACLQGTDVDVGERDLGRERHENVAQVFTAHLQICTRRFELASQTAEDVDLPARVEADLVERTAAIDVAAW
jgi:hypothetical protein